MSINNSYEKSIETQDGMSRSAYLNTKRKSWNAFGQHEFYDDASFSVLINIDQLIQPTKSVIC